MAALGVLTIGQAPRPDGLAKDVAAVLGPGYRIVERGALDGLTLDEVQAMAPGPEDYRLVTLLADGTPVVIAKQHILARLQAQIHRLEREDGVDGTLLVCTGTFPEFDHDKFLIRPQEALYGAVIGLAGGARIGVLTPLPAQVEQVRTKWADMGVSDVAVAAADPYGADPVTAVRRAAAALKNEGAAVVFMDCFGYDLAMKRAARDAFGGPVLLARSLAARLAAEVLQG